MVSALDFMMACVGVGILLVCAAWSFKILTDTRTRIKVHRDVGQRSDEPLDPLGQQLQEIRTARFGMRMAPTPRGDAPPTWPVMAPRRADVDVKVPQIKGPIPSPTKSGKKQGGK